MTLTKPYLRRPESTIYCMWECQTSATGVSGVHWLLRLYRYFLKITGVPYFLQRQLLPPLPAAVDLLTEHVGPSFPYPLAIFQSNTVSVSACPSPLFWSPCHHPHFFPFSPPFYTSLSLRCSALPTG